MTGVAEPGAGSRLHAAAQVAHGPREHDHTQAHAHVFQLVRYRQLRDAQLRRCARQPPLRVVPAAQRRLVTV